ncbi:MAG: DUF2905 domain-containing protein [Leptospiraceae bacterium]|nr:DUF2905 domain-containing protein [Leptospiraceae bacterium]MCK6381918.1 DUF2905 domain-containing protein [Leptospiraceae bacterium]NUM41977.1 DUF2905 domain-containing protein [Leptospiraceae bacterium]
MPVDGLGKNLIVLGVLIFLIGVFFSYGNKIPYLGKLPGDINIKKEGFSFYFPLTTSIVLSIAISVILWLFSKRSP